MKKILLLICLLFITVLTSYSSEAIVLPSVLGKVLSVNYIEGDNDLLQNQQLVEIKVLNGELRGQTISLNNVLTGNPYYDLTLKKGTKVVLHVEQGDDGLEFSIQDILRVNILRFLGLLFCGLLIYVGRKKGVCSLISILITIFLVIKVLSPMILLGINPILVTISISLISTAITMFLVGGFNKKSTAAIIGCTLSLIFAATLSLITVKLASLSGFSDENSLFLYSIHPELDFIAITVSTMIIATMGAVMDVSMSIASTINEIHSIDNSKTAKELFKSGMNVGKDIIGTMANTLILVYLGTSLPLILLLSNIDMQKFINLNQVVAEISSALIGSCALILCVPITALISAILIKKDNDIEVDLCEGL